VSMDGLITIEKRRAFKRYMSGGGIGIIVKFMYKLLISSPKPNLV
jgi:hypothetical protein